MICNAGQLADIYEIDRRTVTNWINSTPPCPSTLEGRERKFDTAAVARWHTQRAVADAVANISREAPTDLADAEKRKAIADAQLAEIKVAKEEGALIPMDVHEAVFEEWSEKLRAIVVNIPSNHALELERIGITSAQAQYVLESISDNLMRALQASADDLEHDDDAND